MEKLTRANTTLRAKNRALKQEAGDAAERVALLEAELLRLERRAARQQALRQEAAGPARGRRRAERDPGDAVPEGVAVQEPEPLSEADRAVLEHLEETLAPD